MPLSSPSSRYFKACDMMSTTACSSMKRISDLFWNDEVVEEERSTAGVFGECTGEWGLLEGVVPVL